MNCLRLFRFSSFFNTKTSLIRTISNTSKKFDDKSSNKKDENESVKQLLKKRKKVNTMFARSLVDTALFLFISFAGYMIYKRLKGIKNEEKQFDIKYVDDQMFTKGKLIKTNIADYFLPEFFKKHLSQFKSIELRNDDVWIVSFPKSGTTWIQEIVYLIVNNCDFSKAKSKSIEDRMPFIDFPNPGINAIKKLESPRIIKTHLPKPFLPEDIEKKCKMIYIVRNPKDVSVSYYHFIKMSTQVEFKGNFSDFFISFVKGCVPYGPWLKHIEEYLSTPNVHIVAYEDLHSKPFETVKEVCKFLGKDTSDDDIKKIIEWCSYKNMKENKSVNYEWYKEFGLFKKDGHFFRKGEIGDWLNYYTKDMSVILDTFIEKNSKSNFKFDYGISQAELSEIYKNYDENNVINKIFKEK